MSAAFVPGRILLVAPMSGLLTPPSSCSVPVADAPMVGDFGPIWTSVKGGGLGSRGELEGDMAPALVVMLGSWPEMLTGEGLPGIRTQVLSSTSSTSSSAVSVAGTQSRASPMSSSGGSSAVSSTAGAGEWALRHIGLSGAPCGSTGVPPLYAT